MRSALVLMLFCCMAQSGQQQSGGERWTGEWGSYREAQSNGAMHSEGQRLSITSCLRDTCQATVATSLLSGDHCDGSGDLHIDGPTQATVTLKSPGGDKKNECYLSLTLREDGKQRSIEAKGKSGKCDYFCTPKCSFERAFVFHSATPFYGDDIPGCFLARSKALVAVCSDKSLSDLQHSWMGLADETATLLKGPGHQDEPGSGTQRDQAQAKCSSAEDPAGCLRAFFKTDGDRLTKLKANWQASVTRPGDSKEAERKANAIAGIYTRKHNNGTVQGDRYQSTDSLEVKQANEGSIGFKVDLSFYNGHSCKAQGTAAYKSNGAFVFQSAEPGGSCVLEIFAGEKGVVMEDPTGGCQSFCGARGTLAGASFLYSERQSAAR